MRNSHVRRRLRLAVSALAIGVATGFVVPGVATASEDSPEDLALGKQLAFDVKKGNCLACHAMDDGALAGNGGPPMIAMKARFPDRKRLRDQLWDATAKNPNSIMPPFGRHGILTDDEIDKITAYLLSL